jgi:uncharacterized LabA/DUF88 family protein
LGVALNKIAIFVDVQNIYYTTRDAFSKQFNYRLLWQELLAQGDIVTAKAYAIQRSDDQQHKFQQALKYIGFDVKLKPFIQRKDGTAKGDWDVGITIDIMETAPKVDTIILLSGDGDFDLLLKKVREKFGVKTQVYSVEALTAKSLIDAADIHHKIEQSLLL